MHQSSLFITTEFLVTLPSLGQSYDKSLHGTHTLYATDPCFTQLKGEVWSNNRIIGVCLSCECHSMDAEEGEAG